MSLPAIIAASGTPLEPLPRQRRKPRPHRRAAEIFSAVVLHRRHGAPEWKPLCDETDRDATSNDALMAS